MNTIETQGTRFMKFESSQFNFFKHNMNIYVQGLNKKNKHTSDL